MSVTTHGQKQIIQFKLFKITSEETLQNLAQDSAMLGVTVTVLIRRLKQEETVIQKKLVQLLKKVYNKTNKLGLCI